VLALQLSRNCGTSGSSPRRSILGKFSHGCAASFDDKSVSMAAPNTETLPQNPAQGTNHGQVTSTMIDNKTATTTVFISRPSTLCTLTIRRIELVTTVVSVVPNVAEQPIAR
jgi:hypothetical protein